MEKGKEEGSGGWGERNDSPLTVRTYISCHKHFQNLNPSVSTVVTG
jgi:hypothetical protein